jgi:hypothetical protein
MVSTFQMMNYTSESILQTEWSIMNMLCRQISNWIWFPLIQHELDLFVDRQNAHRIRKQSERALPSGGRPDQFYTNPLLYGGESCLIKVDMEEIDGLLWDSEDGLLRMRYVDEIFEPLAEEASQAIVAPNITLETAWIVFRRMVGQLSDNDMNSP